jgi:hypothetical protein
MKQLLANQKKEKVHASSVWWAHRDQEKLDMKSKPTISRGATTKRRHHQATCLEEKLEEKNQQ